MNKVELIGFAGMDPEVKSVGEKNKVARFTFATNESYKKNEEWVKITQWHNVIGWNKIADQIDALVKKGKKLSIVGKLTYRTYQGKDGKTQKSTDIVVTEVSEAAK